MKLLDMLIYSLILALYAYLISTFEYIYKDVYVMVSFIINGLFFICFYISSKEAITIKKTIEIFCIFFMFLAPLSQYGSGTVLWSSNGLRVSYSNEDYLFANIIILLFFLVFELGYGLYVPNENKKVSYTYRGEKSLWRFCMIGFVVLALNIVTNGFSSFRSSSSLAVQIRNMVMFFPVEMLIISVLAYKRGQFSRKGLVLVVVQCLATYLLYSNNMPRFMFLGALMAVCTFFFRTVKCTSLYLLMYTIGFVFVFSVIRGQGFLSYSTYENIKLADFNHVDFDAYQILLASIKYVKEEGILWGKNILSAMLNFIPRSIWHGKLDFSGKIIAHHYGSWYTNISCPVQAECYLAFGIPGILLLGFLFGLLVKKIDSWKNNEDDYSQTLFCIISGLTIYIMRGSLLSTIAYATGIILVFYLLFGTIHIKIK